MRRMAVVRTSMGFAAGAALFLLPSGDASATLPPMSDMPGVTSAADYQKLAAVEAFNSNISQARAILLELETEAAAIKAANGGSSLDAFKALAESMAPKWDTRLPQSRCRACLFSTWVTRNRLQAGSRGLVSPRRQGLPSEGLANMVTCPIPSWKWPNKRAADKGLIPGVEKILEMRGSTRGRSLRRNPFGTRSAYNFVNDMDALQGERAGREFGVSQQRYVVGKVGYHDIEAGRGEAASLGESGIGWVARNEQQLAEDAVLFRQAEEAVASGGALSWITAAVGSTGIPGVISLMASMGFRLALTAAIADAGFVAVCVALMVAPTALMAAILSIKDPAMA